MAASLGLIGAAVFGVTPARAADVAVLVNGDRVTGQVQSLAGGSVVFASEKAGTLTIAVGGLTSLTTDKPLVLLLKDGSTITGKLAAGPAAGQFTVGLADGTTRSASLADIKFINPPVHRWQGDVAAGLSVFQTTTSTQNYSATGDIRRDTDTTTFRTDAAYIMARAQGVTSEDSKTLTSVYDFGVNQPRFGFLNLLLKTDNAQRLDLRAIEGLGIGFVNVKRPDLSFQTRVGLSVVSESYRDTSSTTHASANLGYTIDAKLGKTTSFHHELSYLPDVSHPSNSLLRGLFSIDRPLADAFYLSLKTDFERTSQPAAGVPRNTDDIIAVIGRHF